MQDLRFGVSISNIGRAVKFQKWFRTHEVIKKRVQLIFKDHTLTKVKESRNRPGVAQRVPGGLGAQIS